MVCRGASQIRIGSAIGLTALLLAAGCDRASLPEEPASIELLAARRVVALGRLEPAGGIISISAVPGERLKRFAPGVEEGAKVPAGAELAFMASIDLRQAQLEAVETKLKLARQQQEYELAVAAAQVEQAEATKAQAEAKRQEVVSQKQTLDNLAEAAEIAEADYQTLADLQASDPELVTDQQLRRRRNASERAVKEYEAAAATYPSTLVAAEKAVEAAEANVRLARQNRELAEKVDETQVIEMERRVAVEARDQSVLRAPAATDDAATEFTVLQIMLQPGEFVAQLPILELGDLSRMVCVAEVYEADAKELAPGQKAVIRSPAFSGQFANGGDDEQGGIAGKVVRMGSLVTSPGLTNRNPLAPSDRSVVEVLVGIDPEDAAATREASRRIGLQVTVEFGEKKGDLQPDDANKIDSAGGAE